MLTLFPPVALAQGTVTTSDGLRLSLSSAGTVSSLQLNGVERASGSVSPSGFVWRELPAAASNSAPNGSFESGSSSPTSWSWTDNSGATWDLDTSTAGAGSRSMKASIPGTTAKRGPNLLSPDFAILPNSPYTLSCEFRTSGLSSGLTLYLVEEAADGSVLQRGLTSRVGTNAWYPRSLTFTTGPTAVRASLKAQVYNGYGTAWLDDVKLTDVFGGRREVAFGGSVASDPGGMTQTATASGLTFNARFTTVGTAIRVDATVTDTTGQDRPVEVSFRLPLDVPGWTWDANPVTSSVIASGIRYENLDTSFGAQTHSLYPFATVRNASAAVTLAAPMKPQMQRFAYDTEYGLRSTWDLGLSTAATKTRSKAAFTFWIYKQSPKWGFRAAAEKYYDLNPSSFTSSASLNGAWALPGRLALDTVPNAQDFGWGLVEGIGDVEFANANGLLTLHYVDPSAWFRNFPDYAGGPQPPYAVLISELVLDALAGTGTTVDNTPVKEMAQAVINSSPYDESALYQVLANSYFWYGDRIQVYPVSADPGIPAPSMWSIIKKYSVDGMIANQQKYGNTVDGIFLDDITYTFGNVENHRRALWAYSDSPLTFSYATRRVMLFDGFSTGEFCGALRSYLNGKGMTLMGSVNPGMYKWFAPQLDIVGGEVPGPDSTEKTYARRVLGYGRPWSNLLVNNTDSSPPDAAKVLAYLRQALLMGYFPGFAGEYWNHSPSYERDRSLVKKYMALIRKTVAAGWQPVNYATPSDPVIFVERFDGENGRVFYLAAQNSDTSSSTFQLTVDGAGLGIPAGTVAVRELVGATTISATRSGANVVWTDTLAPGETVLYEITQPADTPPPPGDGGPAAALLNGSFEDGTSAPTGWSLGTSPDAGSWTWDGTQAASGDRSVKITVSGSADENSPQLMSDAFALEGGRTYTLRAWMKSTGVAGTYAPSLYVVELDSAGNVLETPEGWSMQHGVKGNRGTGGWVAKNTTFTTDPRCARAYIYANIYKGYGTVSIDYVQIY